MYLLIQCAVAAAIVGLLFMKNFIPLDPILGIYRQNSKYFYLKLCTMLALMTIRKRKSGTLEDVEKRQPLSDNPMVSVHSLKLKDVIHLLRSNHVVHLDQILYTKLQKIKTAALQKNTEFIHKNREISSDDWQTKTIPMLFYIGDRCCIL